MIKAVIFDMDGLLVDSDPLWRWYTRETYKKLGVELTDEHHLIMIGRPTLENAEHLYERYHWKGPSPAKVATMITEEVIKGIKRGIPLMPGVHHVLSVCKKAGLPVAIASSADARVINIVVDTLEIREHFEHIYSAQFEKYGKPHPGVFLSVAEHFKISPHDCLVFEDAPAGVLAAKAARMACVAVPAAKARKHPFILTADAVIDSLEDFDERMLTRLGSDV